MDIKNDYETEKACRTCKYFRRHYVKENYTYRTYCCGDCLNTNFKYKDRRKSFPYIQGCDFWEPDNRVQERKEKIDEVLRRMENTLSDIRAILKDDCNK